MSLAVYSICVWNATLYICSIEFVLSNILIGLCEVIAYIIVSFACVKFKICSLWSVVFHILLVNIPVMSPLKTKVLF